MSFRAILIGLLFGSAIAALGYFNDWVMNQAYLATNLTPVAVYGFLIVGLLCINPLLRVIRCRPFRPAEWCVLIALMLVACATPGPGLLWQFTNVLVMPHHFQQTESGWTYQNHKMLDYVPDVMLVDPGADPDSFDKVVMGFERGLPEGQAGFSQVPWRAWSNTLTFWLSLLVLSFVATICLVVVLHRQWSRREHLRYPLAYVASELITGGSESGGGMFRNKIFWLGFAIPAFIILVNGYYVWNHNSISIPTYISLESVGAKWPSLQTLPMSRRLLKPTIYFAAVGFAFFVHSDISFSLGINHVVYAAVFLTLTNAGVRFLGDSWSGGIKGFIAFGAYIGMLLVILYLGRKFYLAVLSKAFWIPNAERVEKYVVWAFRLALVSMAAMVLVLVFALGLDWILAVLFVALMMMMFVVLTRINVETGLFMIQSGWLPVAVITGLLGFVALGANTYIILAVLCAALVVDPSVCLMPLAANAVKLGETGNVNPRRLSRWLIIAAVLALVVGVIATVWVQYVFGGGFRYNWAQYVARGPFDTLAGNLRKFATESVGSSSFRLAEISPDISLLRAGGIGLMIVLGLSALRLRYRWWPIHPVLILVWGTFPGGILAPSFLMGWLLKRIVVTFGGRGAYATYTPFFMGLIAGEFLGAIFWMIVGVIYYHVNGVPGPVFRILPA